MAMPPVLAQRRHSSPNHKGSYSIHQRPQGRNRSVSRIPATFFFMLRLPNGAGLAGWFLYIFLPILGLHCP